MPLAAGKILAAFFISVKRADWRGGGAGKQGRGEGIGQNHPFFCN